MRARPQILIRWRRAGSSRNRKARSFSDNFDKALWPTTVLQVRRAVTARGRQEGGILFGNKFRKLRRHPVRKAFSHAARIGLCRATLGLSLLRGRSEYPAGVIHL